MSSFRDLGVVHLPELTNSDLYDDSPATAIQMWLRGFRPWPAHELSPGWTIAYWDDLPDGRAFGEPHLATVVQAVVDHAGDVVIRAMEGTYEGTHVVDPDREVWVDPPRKQLYCHACRRLTDATTDEVVAGPAAWSCDMCGETILCDECGQEWSDDHECDERCTICGERFTDEQMEHGNYAEMYDPNAVPQTNAGVSGHAGVVHAECGLARGWELA